MQAGAQVVPGLRVELAPVGEDEVLEAGDAGPGDKGITKRRIDTIIQIFKIFWESRHTKETEWRTYQNLYRYKE